MYVTEHFIVFSTYGFKGYDTVLLKNLDFAVTFFAP